jgi:D-3-phosphoglycerate dehydrogenase
VKVVVAGAEFPNLEIERRILGAVGAEIVDACGLPWAEAAELCLDADAVMTDYFRCDATLIERLERCRVICQYGVGLDQIDVPAATAAGILVTHTPAYCFEELADHTIGLLLAIARGIAAYDRGVRAGGWDYNAPYPLHRLRGRTLGIVGFGRVGRAVAERAGPFGLRVVATDAFQPESALREAGVEPLPLDRLLTESHIVSLHAPLTEKTRGLIGSAELAAMKPGAILVNTARGALVDQAALAQALASGHLGGAGLDVLEREPPERPEPLLGMENVVVTPHAGFLSEESLLELQTEASQEVALALTGGLPRQAVNARQS